METIDNECGSDTRGRDGFYASQRTSTLHPKPQWSYYRRILTQLQRSASTGPVDDNSQLIFLLKIKLYTHISYTRHHKHNSSRKSGGCLFSMSADTTFPLMQMKLSLPLQYGFDDKQYNLNAILHYAQSTIQKIYNLHICCHVLLKTAPK